ncbi:internal virion protein [Ralstonia phage RPSC1]|uniref:Putative internal virion protein A n=1 Tax=Ralstonia phage RPSC1 TaxID=2041351 RepID=A0A2Z2U7R6_9CAUD|nr:internal virion protein [Ralstonia phage RPSC1]ATN92934.1 putative internal virion protein A [Ralstonia phage RPSC1]
MALTVSPLTRKDIGEMSMRIRADDVLEYRAHSGNHLGTLWDTLMALVGVEDEHYVEAVRNQRGHLVALGGWSVTGVCWFLCTSLVDHHARDFVRHIKARRDTLLDHVDVLTNEVMVTNALHVRFLKHLGAEFSADTFNRNGQEFARFYIQRKEVPHV